MSEILFYEIESINNEEVEEDQEMKEEIINISDLLIHTKEKDNLNLNNPKLIKKRRGLLLNRDEVDEIGVKDERKKKKMNKMHMDENLGKSLGDPIILKENGNYLIDDKELIKKKELSQIGNDKKLKKEESKSIKDKNYEEENKTQNKEEKNDNTFLDEEESNKKKKGNDNNENNENRYINDVKNDNKDEISNEYSNEIQNSNTNQKRKKISKAKNNNKDNKDDNKNNENINTIKTNKKKDLKFPSYQNLLKILDKASSKPKKAKSKIKLHLKKSSKIKNSLNVKKSFENNNRLSTNSNQSIYLNTNKSQNQRKNGELNSKKNESMTNNRTNNRYYSIESNSNNNQRKNSINNFENQNNFLIETLEINKKFKSPEKILHLNKDNNIIKKKFTPNKTFISSKIFKSNIHNNNRYYNDLLNNPLNPYSANWSNSFLKYGFQMGFNYKKIHLGVPSLKMKQLNKKVMLPPIYKIKYNQYTDNNKELKTNKNIASYYNKDETIKSLNLYLNLKQKSKNIEESNLNKNEELKEIEEEEDKKKKEEIKETETDDYDDNKYN